MAALGAQRTMVGVVDPDSCRCPPGYSNLSSQP